MHGSIALRRVNLIVRVIAVWLCAGVLRAEVVEVAYSFTANAGGGVVVVQIDTQTGKILDQRVLFQESDCRAPKKLRRSVDGASLVVTNELSKGPHIFIVATDRPGDIHRIELSDLPDEIRVTNGYALVSCADDTLALIDIAERTVARTWSAEAELSPPGNAPEDMLLLPDGQHVLVSFQKDSKSGRKLGNRLVLFSFPELDVVADMPLPRNRSELHIAHSKREQGPSPEVLLFSEKADTLLVTLDLYGAVAMMKGSGILAGKIDGYRALPTSLDGSWGEAFPDLATQIEIDGRSYAIVCNAGSEGGAVLVDLAERQIVRKWRVPSGLAEPAFLPEARLAVSVRSGKLKRRTETGLVKESHPGKAIYLFDLASPDAAGEANVEELRLKVYAVALTAIDPGESRLILLAAGRGPSASMLLVFDPVAKRFLDRRDAAGHIVCFEK
ncbi:MAG: YncE family protein [Pirellulales bacterium]